MEIANVDLWFQQDRSTSCKGYHIVLAPHHVTLWRHWLCFFSLSGSSQTAACWQQLGWLGCSNKFPSKKLWFREESHTFWEVFCVHTFVNTKSRNEHWKGDARRLLFTPVKSAKNLFLFLTALFGSFQNLRSAPDNVYGFWKPSNCSFLSPSLANHLVCLPHEV